MVCRLVAQIGWGLVGTIGLGGVAVCLEDGCGWAGVEVGEAWLGWLGRLGCVASGWLGVRLLVTWWLVDESWAGSVDLLRWVPSSL